MLEKNEAKKAVQKDSGCGKMSYKDYIVKELKNLQNERDALKSLPEQIKTIEMEITLIKATDYDRVIVSGGGENLKEQKLIEKLAQKQERELDYEITKRKVKELEDAFFGLTKEQQLVLDQMYIRRRYRAVELLCEELSLEKTRIYEMKDEALIELARRKYGQVKM